MDESMPDQAKSAEPAKRVIPAVPCPKCGRDATLMGPIGKRVCVACDYRGEPGRGTHFCESCNTSHDPGSCTNRLFAAVDSVVGGVPADEAPPPPAPAAAAIKMASPEPAKLAEPPKKSKDLPLKKPEPEPGAVKRFLQLFQRGGGK